MRTEDHENIGRYLVKKIGYSMEEECVKALLKGSIIPDHNPITYLRGSMRAQMFRGHNYENSYPCMQKIVCMIAEEREDKVKRSYYLGKLLHYAVDAFTFPHNKEYEGSIREHRRYERALHECMKEILKNDMFHCSALKKHVNVIHSIEELHEEYGKEKASALTDCYYILQAASLIFYSYAEHETVQIVRQECVA